MLNQVVLVGRIVRDLELKETEKSKLTNLVLAVPRSYKNINGEYTPVIPFPTNEKAFNDFIYHIGYFTGNKYLVTGDLLDETGTNGEPLINNVKIIKKL